MQLTATKAHLVNALTIAARIAAPTGAIQAGQGAPIDATDTAARISATDFSMSITLPLVTEANRAGRARSTARPPPA